MTHLAIAEDNGFLVQAIRDKLAFADDMHVAWTARDGDAFLRKLKQQDAPPDLVLMDIEMPNLNGIETTRQLKALHPQVKVVMLTAFDNDELIFEAIQARADGYLLKEVDAEALAAGIRETLAGGAAMTPAIAAKTLRLLRQPLPETVSTEESETVQLSARERDVLEQLAKGLTYQAVADNLFISPHTVRKHVERLYGKLQVHNKLQAVSEARRLRLL